MSNILLVDDSATIRHELRLDLEEEGFTVFEAEDGESGLTMAINESLDLIITDLNMPNMDGITMCKHIHQNGIKTPIFMMTTQTNTELKVEAKEFGVKAWIVKPYNKKSLLSGIKKMTT